MTLDDMTPQQIEDHWLAEYRAGRAGSTPNARRAAARRGETLDGGPAAGPTAADTARRALDLAARYQHERDQALSDLAQRTTPNADAALARKYGFAPGALELADQIAGIGLDGSVTLRSGQVLTREQARALFAGGGAR